MSRRDAQQHSRQADEKRVEAGAATADADGGERLDRERQPHALMSAWM
jgi:hypothetical protein